MARYGMVIDLKLCIGCNACTMACKAEHGTQPGVFRESPGEGGKYPKPTRLFMPVLCYHCSDPLCVAVCPTGASHVSEEGLVLIDYDKCAGCGPASPTAPTLRAPTSPSAVIISRTRPSPTTSGNCCATRAWCRNATSAWRGSGRASSRRAWRPALPVAGVW